MKRLKIVSKGFETYTGAFGPVQFVDGLSVDPVPEIFARRIAAATPVMWVDDDGKELEDASVAHTLVRDATMRAPVLEESPRQSDAEKRAEDRAKVLKVIDADVMQIYSRNELEAVVEKDGVKALRVIGDKWKVKHKQAIALIDMILAQQSKWIDARNERLKAAGVGLEVKETVDGADTDGNSDDDSGAGDAGTADLGDPAGETPAADPADSAEGPETDLASDAVEGESQPEPEAK